MLPARAAAVVSRRHPGTSERERRQGRKGRVVLLGVGPGWAALPEGLPGHSPSAFPKEDKQPSENLRGARGLLSGPCPGTQPAPPPRPRPHRLS